MEKVIIEACINLVQLGFRLYYSAINTSSLHRGLYNWQKFDRIKNLDLSCIGYSWAATGELITAFPNLEELWMRSSLARRFIENPQNLKLVNFSFNLLLIKISHAQNYFPNYYALFLGG